MGCFGDAISLLLMAITRLRRKLIGSKFVLLLNLTHNLKAAFGLFCSFVFCCCCCCCFLVLSFSLSQYKKDALACLPLKSRLCSYNLWVRVIHFFVICRPNELNDDLRYAPINQQGRVLGPRVLPQGPSTTSAPRNGPIDPTVPFAVPQKKRSAKKPRSEPSEPAIGRFWFLLLLWNPGKTNAVINILGNDLYLANARLAQLDERRSGQWKAAGLKAWPDFP